MKVSGLVTQTPWVAAVAFLVGLGLAATAALWNEHDIHKDAEAEFQHSRRLVLDHVTSSLQRPVYGLNGAKAVYAASKRVERAEFRAYVESRNLGQEFPGVRGFASIQHVLRPQLPAFIAAERADGAPDFAVRQLQDKSHDDYYIVKFMEPAINNPGAQGLDLGSEPNRRAAIQRAVDTGLPTITPAITLVQDQGKTPGVLIFVPVYANGPPATTPAARRASLRGVLSAPLVMSDALNGMLDARDGLIDFQLFDGPSTPQRGPGGTLLFDANGRLQGPNTAGAKNHNASHQPRFSHTQALPVFGRDLTLRVSSTAAFDAQLDHSTSWVLFGGGTLLSALLALLLREQSVKRRQMEDRLLVHVDELKLQKYALDQHAIVATTDVQGKITYVNDKFCDISGYSREELMGQDHSMLNSGHHPHGFFKAMYRTVATGKPWRDEVCNRAKDGHLYWVDTTIVPLMNAHGKPERYLAIRADITPRKLAELELERQKSELELQKYALDQHAIVATTDVQGKITYVNDKFCDISGYAREALMGQDHAMLNSGHHPHGFFKAMYRTVATGKTWRDEVCNRAKDGHLYWVDTTIVPVMNADGKPERYLAIRADITLRKQVELDLVRSQLNLEKRVQIKTQAAVLSEQHLRLVINTSLDAIVGMDAKGCITEWNSQAERTFGWKFAEVVNQPMHNFIIPARYREAHQKGLTRYLAAGGGTILGKRIEIFALRSDGTEFPIEIAISPIITPQGTTFSAFISDLTQRKAEQAALLAAKAQAENASRAKSEFLANMSHEIRTPMNGVIGMVDILQASALLPEQRRMLSTVQKSSMALLQILNDILDFSKIEADKLEIESLPMDLRGVAEEVTLLLASQSGGQSDLSLFVSPELPAWTMGDPSRLRQVLLNLMGNAIKFSTKQEKDNSVVTLSVNPCLLANGDDGVRFDVVDNGIGMEPAVVSKLFQAFTQADESTARKFGGTGLGLSISQRLVDLMGGRITVQSTLGAGSTFSVTLPLRAAQEQRALPALPNLTGVQVLLVSHDAFGIAMRTRYCEYAGAQVQVANDLQAARNLLAQSPGTQPWVVLTDRTVTEPGPALCLPAVASLVREAPRGSQHFSDELVLPVRPLLQADLIQAIAAASGRLNTGYVAEIGLGTERRSEARTGAPTVEQAVKSQRLILLAEDNETNRDVIQEQLRLLGHTCEIAQDGAIALKMWQANPDRYALLLTDCHMPNLDGFGLTSAIRQAERTGQHLPIIAVTANAMQGEAQRCITHGMDAYLSKPLRMNELRDMLEKWLPELAPSPAQAELPQLDAPDAPAHDDAFPLWNPDTLTHLVGNNPGMHKRLLERFVASAKEQVVQITTAAASGDPNTLADVAHALKSAARSVGALRLGEFCQRMETAGRANDGPQCSALANGLMAEFVAAEAAMTHPPEKAITKVA